MHQDSVSNNLLGDKEQNNLHSEWSRDPTEDYSSKCKLVMPGCPSLLPKSIPGKECGKKRDFWQKVTYYMHPEMVRV